MEKNRVYSKNSYTPEYYAAELGLQLLQVETLQHDWEKFGKDNYLCIFTTKGHLGQRLLVLVKLAISVPSKRKSSDHPSRRPVGHERRNCPLPDYYIPQQTDAHPMLIDSADALPTKGWRLELNSTLFNISLSLPTYLSELSTKFVTRLKRLDGLLSQDDPPNPPLYATASNGAPHRNFMFPSQAVPSPWGFVFSGYAIGLLAVVSICCEITPHLNS